jgi:hypothetical protein
VGLVIGVALGREWAGVMTVRDTGVVSSRLKVILHAMIRKARARRRKSIFFFMYTPPDLYIHYNEVRFMEHISITNGVK